jgi:hypothetical protein
MTKKSKIWALVVVRVILVGGSVSTGIINKSKCRRFTLETRPECRADIQKNCGCYWLGTTLTPQSPAIDTIPYGAFVIP